MNDLDEMIYFEEPIGRRPEGCLDLEGLLNYSTFVGPDRLLGDEILPEILKIEDRSK